MKNDPTDFADLIKRIAQVPALVRVSKNRGRGRLSAISFQPAASRQQERAQSVDATPTTGTRIAVEVGHENTIRIPIAVKGGVAGPAGAGAAVCRAGAGGPDAAAVLPDTLTRPTPA
jgi:hypothetical protein